MAEGTLYPSIGAGLRENLMDVVYIITPGDTPFYDMTKDKDTSSPFHLFSTEDLTTRSDNAQVEGAAIDLNEPSESSRVLNITQIFQKTVKVSESRQASNYAAVNDMLADQLRKRMIEIKTDCEHALLRGSLASGNASTARRMNGLLNIISTNATAAASGVTISETLFNSLLEMVWNQGGDPRVALVNGTLKRQISTFTDNVRREEPTASKRRINTVSIYESDFSTVEVILSRDMPNGVNGNAVAVIDPDQLWKTWLRKPKTEEIAKVADSFDARIVKELTLEHGNEKGFGLYTALN